MKRIFLIITLLLLSLAAQAKHYFPVTIRFTEGREISGFAKLPGKKAKPTLDEGASDRAITFKETEDGKKQKLRCETLSTLTFYDKDSIAYTYEYMSSYNVTLFSRGIGAKQWFSLISRGKYLSLYYRKDMASYGKNLSFPQNSYYCMRAGEPAATCLYFKAANQIGLNSMFRKAAVEYFKDHSELAEKIKNKSEGYSYQDLAAIVVEYNAWKSAQP